jgi:hypothetical protein
VRMPLEEIWLHLGPLRDPTDYDFALLMVRGEWDLGKFLLGGRGFALSRGDNPTQPHIDPGTGATTFLQWGSTAFAGDLGILLRGELEYVGQRVSQGAVLEVCGDPEENPPRPLDRYATLGVTATFSLLKTLSRSASRTSPVSVTRSRGSTAAPRRSRRRWVPAASSVSR